MSGIWTRSEVLIIGPSENYEYSHDWEIKKHAFFVFCRLQLFV